MKTYALEEYVSVVPVGLCAVYTNSNILVKRVLESFNTEIMKYESLNTGEKDIAYKKKHVQFNLDAIIPKGCSSTF